MRHTDSSVQHAWVLGGRYRVIDRLGQGGMADVFRAHDELLDRDVAVKVFRAVPQAGEADTQAESRRELELQSLARLSHPNLTTLFDGSVSGDGPGYLVLELVQGPNLAARLDDGPLPEPLARLVCVQIAEALAYVHAHGMVHRDVKPANILLGEDGRPDSIRARLSDFGIVRMVGSERMTAADLTLGTASYIAPEQARGANVEPAADIYSLGLVMIEALTGIRCFDGPLHEALAARLTTSPAIPSDLPHPWPELLAAMTASDPARRPSADQVAGALHADSVTGLLPPPPPVSVPAPMPVAGMVAPPVVRPADADEDWYPEDERRRPVGVLLLTLLAVAAIVAGGAYFLMSDDAQPASTTPPVSPVVHHSASTVKKQHASSVVSVIQHDVAPSHQPSKAPKPSVTSQPITRATHTSTPTTSPSSSPSTSSAPPSSSTPPPPSSTPPATAAATDVAVGP